MKRLIILFISTMLTTLTIHAQESPDVFSVETSKANLQQESIRSFWISGGVGPRGLQTTPGSINTYYVDDSPSEDEFYSSIDIKDKYQRTGLNVEIGFGQKIGLSHSFFVDAALGKSPSTFFGYAAGWEFPVQMGRSDFVLRPAFNLMCGNTGFKLGRLENEDTFIQIDEDQFYNDYLNISLYENLFVIGPRLDVNFLFPKKHGITASLAYDFAMASNKPRLIFAAPSAAENPEGTPASASIKLTNNNLMLKHNDNILKKLPYAYGGFRFTLGLMLTGVR